MVLQLAWGVGVAVLGELYMLALDLENWIYMHIFWGIITEHTHPTVTT